MAAAYATTPAVESTALATTELPHARHAPRPVGRARVLVCDPIPAAAVAHMRAGGLRVDERIGMTPEQCAAHIGEYDAVVVRSATRLRARQLAAARRLQLIVRGGAGTDNIDLAVASARRITVLSTPDAATDSVAELALALLLCLARRIPEADAALKAGYWPKHELSAGIEVTGKTLGIVGMGRIGGALARRAAALGLVVVGTDRSAAPAGLVKGMPMLPLASLLQRSDFVSLHVPPDTGGKSLIGEEEFACMKDGVLLIQCARGGVVDEAALLAALATGRVAGAALDVFAEEPPRDLRLARHPRVVCTPHLGASTLDAQDRIGTEIARILLERL